MDYGKAASTFSEEEVTELVRLLGRVATVADLPSKRQHLLDGVTDLIEADSWVWTLSRFDSDIDTGMTHGFQYGRMTDEDLASIAQSTMDSTDPYPGFGEMRACIRRKLPFTLAARRSTGPDVWLKNANRRKYLSGFSDFMVAGVPTEQAMWSNFGLHRRVGRPPFDERECHLVHIVLTSVPWLHRAKLPEPEHAHAVDSLPPRPRVVLILLLDGRPAKEIAQQLDLSPNTVRQYIKQIYRTLGVTSRGELYTHFAATQVS